MTRVANTNYQASASVQFEKANSDSDQFDAADVQKLAEAVDTHNHSSGLGLPVARVAATSLLPASSDGCALGSTTLMFSDLFLASGGVINWNNGDVTATHAANSLAFAGASSGYSFDAVVTISSGNLIVSSGNVGVGVASPTFNTGAGVAIGRGAASTVRLESTSSGGTGAEIYYDDSYLAFHNLNGAFNRHFRFVNGSVFVNETANGQMTTGITVNQDAADNEIMAFKSSDVDHGVTDSTETDTFAFFKKASANNGGLLLHGISESNVALQLQGTATVDNTAKNTGASAAIYVNAALKSGTAPAANGADANLLAIATNSTVRFLFDAEGSAHADVEWTTFDTHDDVALLDSLEHALDPALARDPVRDAFGNVLRYNRDALQAARIVNFYDDGPRAMVNQTRLLMLVTGSIRQLHDRIAAQASEIAGLRDRLALRGA